MRVFKDPHLGHRNEKFLQCEVGRFRRPETLSENSSLFHTSIQTSNDAANRPPPDPFNSTSMLVPLHSPHSLMPTRTQAVL